MIFLEDLTRTALTSPAIYKKNHPSQKMLFFGLKYRLTASKMMF
jgi:hypothetical protein